MKKLTYNKLFIFFISLIFVIFFLDIIYGNFFNLIRNNKLLSITSKIDNYSTDTLILGSSTSKYLINPNLFLGNSFNAAKNGEGALYSLIVLDNLKNINQLESIIIGLDPEDLKYKFNSKEDINEIRKLLLIDQNQNVSNYFINKNPFYNKLLSQSNLYNFKYLPYMLLDSFRSNDSINGFKALNDSIINSVTILDKIELCKYEGLSEDSLYIFNKFFNLAKEHNIKLIFHISPIYSKLRDKKKCNKKIIQEIDLLISNNPQHCNLIGVYSEQFYKFINNIDYFYDMAHTNLLGSNVYTMMLKKLITDKCYAK